MNKNLEERQARWEQRQRIRAAMKRGENIFDVAREEGISPESAAGAFAQSFRDIGQKPPKDRAKEPKHPHINVAEYESIIARLRLRKKTAPPLTEVQAKKLSELSEGEFLAMPGVGMRARNKAREELDRHGLIFRGGREIRPMTWDPKMGWVIKYPSKQNQSVEAV